jgi:aspartyl-tRNA synthetase
LEESKNLLKYLSSLTLESIVDIQGLVVTANVKSCSQSNVELQIKKIFTVSKTPAKLPFSIEDASRSQEDIANSQLVILYLSFINYYY